MRASSITIDEFLDLDASKSSRALIVIGASLSLLCALLLSTVKVDMVETFQGRLVPSGKVKSVQAPQTGEIKKILVRDGALVQAGQPIALMDTTVSDAEVEKLTLQRARQLASLERINASLNGNMPKFDSYPAEVAKSEEALWQANEGNYHLQIEDLAKQFKLKQIAINTARSSLEKARAEFDNASKQEGLVRDGIGIAISEFSYMNYKSAKTKAVVELDIQGNNLAQAIQEMDMVKAKLVDLKAKRNEDFIKQREQILTEKASVELELVKSQRKAVLTEIVSPESGIVDRLKLTNEGQTLTSGEVVATIVPKDQRLVMRAEASTKDIALVTTGAPASIKIDAYPYQIYGAIKSDVTWISADSEEDSTASGREHGGRHYLLEANIGAWNLGGGDNRLKPGMSASIDVTTQEKTLLSIIFLPIVKNIDQAFRRL